MSMQWIPVEQQLPDDEITVLVATEDGEVWTGYKEGDDWRYVSADLIGVPVIYWMHYPEFPTHPSKQVTA